MKTIPSWLTASILLAALGALQASSSKYSALSQDDFTVIWANRLARAVIQLCAAVLALRAVRRTVLPVFARLAESSQTVVDDRAVIILQQELGSTLSTHHDTNILDPAFLSRCYLLASVTATPLGLHTLAFYPFAERLFWIILSWRCLTVLWKLIVLVCTDVFAHSDLAKSRSLDQKSVEKLLQVLQPMYWLIGALIVCENIGINVTSVAAGMGIGGVAVAVSAQQILQDLFAAFTMLLDGSIRRGDYISLDGADVSGSVVSCGWRSIRIKSPAGHISVLANHDMSGARIKKFHPVQDRLETLVINVDLDTDLQVLLQVPELLRNAVNSVSSSKCQLDDVYLRKFDTAAHVFDVVVSFNGTSLDEYRKCLNDVNMQIAKSFAENNVRFAVPYKLRLTDH